MQLADDEAGRHATDIERLLYMVQGAVLTQALVATVKLGIADFLATAPASIKKLCNQLQLREEAVERLLLLLNAEGFVRENCNDTFELTTLGRYLARGTPQSFGSFVELWGTQWFWDVLRLTSECIRSGKPGLDAYAGSSLFQYLDEVPEAGQQYDLALACLNDPEFSSLLVKACTFSRYRLIVDVGGGTGETLAAVLRSTPASRGILYDRPRLTEVATRTLERYGLSSRCDIQSGNFFESVPSGGDLYILKWILIDWNDADVIRILHTLKTAMGNGARLLVVTGLRGKNDSLLTHQTDVLSLVIPGGFRRSEEQIISLFRTVGFSHCATTAVGRHWMLEFAVAFL